jgi:hypothetical protein
MMPMNNFLTSTPRGDSITHPFPIEDAVEAFRLAQDKSKGVFCVLVEPCQKWHSDMTDIAQLR